MAWNDWGNKPITSTTAAGANAASTATLVAELDSTQLGTKDFSASQSRLYNVTYILGGDTNTKWQVGSASSTSLANGIDEFFPFTPSAQTAQYTFQQVLEKDYRLRARVTSTHGGVIHAYINAVPLT
jgi:hypothetical protein